MVNDQAKPALATGGERLALAEKAAAIAWLAVGAASIFTAIMVAYVGGMGAPYWDQWQYIDPSEYLSNLLERHNGHPIVTGRLAFALDYALFGAQPWFLQALIFATLGSAVAVFVCLARLGGLRTSTSTAIMAGLAATLLFNPQGWENLRWGFQVPFVLTFVAAIAGFWSLAAYAASARVWKLVLSLICSAVAIVSLANGFLVPLLLIAMTIVLGLPLRVLALQGAVALLIIPVMTAPTTGMPMMGKASASEMFVYIFRYLGGGWAWVFNDGELFAPMDASLLIGAALVLGAATAALIVLIRSRRDPTRVALTAIILFIGATAAAAALGRAGSGADQAISSRYAIAGGVLMAALAILTTLQLRDRLTREWRAGLLIVGAVLALASPLEGLLTAQKLAGRQRAEIVAQTALVAGVADLDGIGQLSFNADLARRGSDFLRAHGKWHFQDAWSRAIGQRRNFSNISDCVGEAYAERPSGANFVRLSGFVPAAAARRGRIVIVAQDDGLVVGYGRIPRRRSDLLGGLMAPPAYDWQGHAQTDYTNPALIAYLASPRAIVCRIGTVLAR